MRSRLLPALPLLLGALVVGCASSTHNTVTPRPTPAPAQGVTSPATAPVGKGTVHELRALTGKRWSTSTLSINVGDSVKVTDTDPDVPHNFIVAGVGRSGTLQHNDTFTLTFTKAGTFDFQCSFHVSSGMEGTITVS